MDLNGWKGSRTENGTVLRIGGLGQSTWGWPHWWFTTGSRTNNHGEDNQRNNSIMWINPINKDHELAQKWFQYICFNMIIQKRGALWLKSLGLYQQKHKNHIPNSGTCNQETHHITYKYYRAIEQTTRQFRRIQTSNIKFFIENMPSIARKWATPSQGENTLTLVVFPDGDGSKHVETHVTAIFRWMNHHTMLFPWYENIPWYLYPL